MSGYLYTTARLRLLAPALILFAFGLVANSTTAAEVTLAWESVRAPDAVRYRIYHRQADGRYAYLEPVWEGSETSCTLTGLDDGVSHYFVGRSLDAWGNQSVDSSEIVFHAPTLENETPAPPPDAPPPADVAPRPEPPQSLVDSRRILYDADLPNESGTYWAVLDDDPPGAYAETFYDTVRQSNVTDLVGSWINNSFQLLQFNGDGPSAFTGEGPWHLSWDMKGDLYFFVSIVLQTSDGERTLYYTPSNFDLFGQGAFIHHGLGGSSVDGRWHTHERLLDEDLRAAQPGIRIEGIVAIQIRGRVQIDDLFLTSMP